ncbi:hypothetical protein DEU56DRAFT_940709 [Suillus clintonianus]|uniref:uncharacterized protein n=1 Tax=Suillus clintonianus TaxID=1904413 RepID=UPI001B8791FE|nr:uncharacterized protein DEU56DRAFT_940709 [Suillus clintonianus]KAG2141262.1 hypothetical protein DEU56DRAFT_940709 [Suillus clintonianus]
MDLQRLLLVFTIFTSTFIFSLCWGFILYLWHRKYVILRDPIVMLIAKYPTVLTLIFTVISTILSVTITALFSIAVKQALSHYITQPISLVNLHTAIALTRPQPLLRWSNRRLSLITLVIVGLLTLLNSSWTTLLLPTRLTWPVYIEGKDLDLGSSAFDAKLGRDFYYTSNQSFKNFINLVGIMSPMSGASATRSAVAGGNDSVFAFNGVSYSESTSGILPAVEEFAGTSLNSGNTGLDYYGGKVAVNTTSALNHEYFGLSRNYTVTQQGLSASITCRALDPNDPQYSMSVQVNDSAVNNYGIMFWNVTATCPLGQTHSIWPTVALQPENGNSTTGFLGILVCPNPTLGPTANATSFDIFFQGEAGYNFLNATVCNVSPYVASFDVTYNNGNVTMNQPRNVQPLQHNSVNVTSVIMMVVWELSLYSQTLYDNPLGQLLQLNEINLSARPVYEVLQDYFRGVVEFSATYLRSAYSAEGAATAMPTLYSDQSAFASLNGTMFVTTYGWSIGRPTYAYLIGVFTIIWAITVSAAGYGLIQGRFRSRPLFDASNPVHLMMASSAGGLENIAGFHVDSAQNNEHVRVRLLDDLGVVHGNAAEEGTSVPASATRMWFTIEPEKETNIPK